VAAEAPLEDPSQPLTGLRVLDLADHSGLLCGQILAQLGAEVIALEPPGGSVARRAPPFHDAHSLTWLAGSVAKRSVTLDFACATGRELLLQLVGRADVVIQTARQFRYEELTAVNEQVILATLTPHGGDEPASDLEVTAASGCLWLPGDPGQPPVRTSLPQSPSWTGIFAAAGVLTAVLARDATGRGQHVDVSAQVSMLTATSQAPIFWDLLRQEQHREGAFLVGRSVTGARFRTRRGGDCALFRAVEQSRVFRTSLCAEHARVSRFDVRGHGPRRTARRA
jgi:crotonobetainyl-CoA:carnitine CoA-transferase CaiB-like acyl-CoA transferase